MTESARLATRAPLALARTIAKDWRKPSIGPAEILLGVIEEGAPDAVDLLRHLQFDPVELRAQIEASLVRGTVPCAGDALAFTPDARRVIEGALEEARLTGETRITGEHLLLGLLKHGRGEPARLLRSHAQEVGAVRERIAAMLRSVPTTCRNREHPAVSARYAAYAPALMGHAEREARRLGHDHIATEHMLLALLSIGDGEASRVLAEAGIDPGRLRADVALHLTPGDYSVRDGPLPFSPRAKLALEWAREESGGADVSPEHLLLALLRNANSPTGVILRGFGLHPETTRNRMGRPPRPPCIDDRG